MNISNESEVRVLVESWRNENNFVRQKNMRLVVENLELNMMYYEQKGNMSGVRRMEKCIEVLEDFRRETEKK